MKRAAVLKSEGKKKKKVTRISNAFPLAFISSIKSLIIINCVNCFFRIYLYRFVGFKVKEKPPSMSQKGKNKVRF